MDALVIRRAAQALLVLAALICTTACETTGGVADEGEPVLIEAEAGAQGASAAPIVKEGGEGEVPLVVAESEHPEDVSPGRELEEVIVEAQRERHEVILDLVSEAKSVLRDVELDYVFTGREGEKRCADVLSFLRSGARRSSNGPSCTSRSPALRSNGNPAGRPFPSSCAHQESRRGTSRAQVLNG